MVLAVIIVFAILAGYVVTSSQMLNQLSPVDTPAPAQTPTPSITPSPTATATPTPAGVWSQVQAARLFEQVEVQVERLRELSPQAGVPLSFADQDQMERVLEAASEEDLEGRFLPYVLVGALPRRPRSVDAEPVAGVYVPQQEQLYIGTERSSEGADDQALLAHAYAHVLQNQHFDLRAKMASVRSTDERLALEALEEGDAQLLTALYRYGDLDSADWDHLAALTVRAEVPSYGSWVDESAFWTRVRRFPYREGRQFAQSLFLEGGWAEVNRAYADRPTSTEQILHPERYLEERDRPTEVLVPALQTELDADWQLVVRDTLGELVMAAFLDEYLPQSRAAAAAAGWDGDTLVAWENEAGEWVWIWRSVWDSPGEAAEFERALVALMPQLQPPVESLDPPMGFSGSWWSTPDEDVAIARVARHVAFVQASALELLEQAVAELPEGGGAE